jgi:hypothetical protein
MMMATESIRSGRGRLGLLATMATALALGYGGVGTTTAKAGPPPPPPTQPTLQGERLAAGCFTITFSPFFFCEPTGTAKVTCTVNSDGSATATFDARGTAPLPYAGPFREFGRVTLAPGAGAPVTSFFAFFSIQSPKGTVFGIKTLSKVQPPVFNGCNGFRPTNSGGPGTQTFDFVAGNFDYVALIFASTGTFKDSGTGTFQLQKYGGDTTGTPPLPAFNGYEEGFDHSNGLVSFCHEDESDDDDNACGPGGHDD